MEFIKLTQERYKEWDDFCEASDDAWFWHTSSWLEYSLKYNQKLKAESKSFMVYNNNELIAICPLILQINGKGIKELCYNNEHGPMPAFCNNLSKKTNEKAMKDIYNYIDKIAEENNVARIMLRFTVLSKSFIEASRQAFNYLMKFAYLDNSINTQIINLNQPIEILKKDLRNDHKNNIKKISQKLSTEIFGKNNIADSIFNQYVGMHHKAAGRVTRPRSTFNLMHDLIKEGSAFLVGAKRDGVFIGFSYFFVFKDNVYYGSSCNDPELKSMPVSHVVQWAAIQYMAEKKYKFYELGWQQFGLQLYDMPSQKQINISEFKRGFGGFTVPWLRGEKFYDKNYFLEIHKDRIKKYSEQL